MTSSVATPTEGAATLDELWGEVVGQPDLVGALRAAAASPVHAYLLVGPEGSGRRAAASAFAAELLVRSASETAEGELATAEVERIVRLVDTGVHPSLAFVERDGASISAEQARDVVRRASMAPGEGDLQV
ncbi:MAG: DNA polymerase III subunit delta', partial [Microthrixaceae bacterium]